MVIICLFQKLSAMHFIYYINRSIATKGDSTYFGLLTYNKIQNFPCGNANNISNMEWYGNSLFDITEKYIVIAKYLIKYMIYVWRLHK